jgi:hypothetical protein
MEIQNVENGEKAKNDTHDKKTLDAGEAGFYTPDHRRAGDDPACRDGSDLLWICHRAKGAAARRERNKNRSNDDFSVDTLGSGAYKRAPRCGGRTGRCGFPDKTNGNAGFAGLSLRLTGLLFDIVGKEEREAWSALSLRVSGALWVPGTERIVSDSTFLSGSHQFVTAP